MIRLAITCLVIGLIAAVLGFGGIAGTFIGVAKILFFVALALFAIFLIAGLVTGKSVANSID